MLGIKSSSSGLTRRNFLKVGALGAAGLAAAGSMTGCSDWLSATTTNSDAEEKVAYTFHQMHCGGSCSLKCTVRDGRLCLIEPNDNRKQARHRVLCQKGLSEVQHVYSVERIQTPMKRVGERGEGEYIQITWDEALSEIAEKVKELWNSYGKNSILCRVSGEPNMPLITALLGAQNGGKNGQDIGAGNGLDPAFGTISGTYVGSAFALSPSDVRDCVNAKTWINMGCNYLESSQAQSSFFFDAKQAGCHIITIDPHFSTTAGKSHEWYPDIPGTDAAVLLGMITSIIDNKWYDEDFMKKYTSFPFLVSMEDRSLLCPNAQEVTETKAAKTKDASVVVASPQYYVWDSEAGEPVLHTAVADGANPALEGTFEIDGITYKTVFQLLKESQEDYSLEWAESVCGVAADKLEYLADRYANHGPSILGYGYGGGDKFSNADVAGHAGAVLAALTGNIGKKGATVGIYGGWWSGPIISFGSWKFPAEIAASKAEMNIYEMPTKENNVHAYFSFGDKLVQEIGDFNKKAEWLKSLDLIVYCDMYYSSGSDWADYLLPTTTKFEGDAPIGKIRSNNGLVMTQEKILDPLFEAKTDFWIEHALGEALGFGEYLPENPEALIRAMLDNSKDKRIDGITYEKLLESKGGMEVIGDDVPRIGFSDRVFGTLSKKMEVYYESGKDVNQALPRFEQANEAYVDNPLREKYPLQICNARTRYHIHNQFCDATWITQYYEPKVELNPIDAEERGLESGDMVEVFNDRGSFSTVLSTNEAVRPGSVRAVEGNWTKFLNSGNLQCVTNNAINPRGGTLPAGSPVPFNDTLVEVRKASEDKGGAL